MNLRTCAREFVIASSKSRRCEFASCFSNSKSWYCILSYPTYHSLHLISVGMAETNLAQFDFHAGPALNAAATRSPWAVLILSNKREGNLFRYRTSGSLSGRNVLNSLMKKLMVSKWIAFLNRVLFCRYQVLMSGTVEWISVIGGFPCRNMY